MKSTYTNGGDEKKRNISRPSAKESLKINYINTWASRSENENVFRVNFIRVQLINDDHFSSVGGGKDINIWFQVGFGWWEKAWKPLRKHFVFAPPNKIKLVVAAVLIKQQQRL